MGDGGEQVHFLVPAGLGALALLAVDRDALACGDVPGIASDGGIEPGVERVRPEPAVLAVLPEAGRGRGPPPPPLPPVLLLAPPFRPVRGLRRRGRPGRRAR